jgi:hypothetical protein
MRQGESFAGTEMRSTPYAYRPLKSYNSVSPMVLQRHVGTIYGSNGAGWSSPVAREAHNLEVAGSNPVPAT